MPLGDIVRDIIVRIRMETKGVKEANQEVTRSVQNINKQVTGFRATMALSQPAFKSLNMATQLSTKQFQSFAKSIPMKQWNELGFQLSRSGKRVKEAGGNWIGFGRAQKILASRTVEGGGRMANTFRRLTHGMRGFRMEMLGVMFFGMGMQRMFMSLLQPAMQTAGLFEIFSTTLEVLFLPVALSLLEPLLALMDWFSGMPEPMQLLIGQFALLGAAVGTFLFLVGTLALGLGSITLAFGPLLGALGLGSSGFIGMSSAIQIPLFAGLKATLVLLGGVMLVIAGLALLLWGAWQKNSQGITNALMELQNAFWRFFVPIKGIVEGVIEFFQALFAGDARAAFDALKKIAGNAVNAVIAFFTDLVPAILEVLRNVLWGIGKFVVDMGVTLFELGKMILESLGRGIVGAYGFVKEAIRGIPFIGPFLAGGLDLAESVAGAIGGAVSGAVRGITRFVEGTIPRFQHGGLVTRPTIGLLGESGPEMVTPLGGGGMGPMTINPIYNINATISSDMDIRALAEKLNDALVSDYRRLINR